MLAKACILLTLLSEIMKEAKQVVLKQAVNIGALQLNGVRTLGAGTVRNKETMVVDYERQVIVVERHGATAEIPIANVEYIVF